MRKIVECVPNISEGRDLKKVEAITALIDRPGAKFILADSDPDHNRTVITFAGEPKTVLEAAYDLTVKASELIDMSTHRGEHPRMGAVDVCPFVPIEGVTTKDCIKLAYALGQRLDKYGLPGYYYGHAAKTASREKLSDIRRGEYEALSEKLTQAEWAPDFGPVKFNAKFGAMVIGARDFLVAYNVNLNTLDETLADRIARILRKTGGEEKFGENVKFRVGGVCESVQACMIDTRDRGYMQVSMNLNDYRSVNIPTVFTAIKRIAELLGVRVHSSEIVGVTRREALGDVPLAYLQLKDFDPKKHIIEEALGL